MIETKMTKLSANENCYGCSPLALEAIQKKYKEVYFYPEVNPVALKEKLADKFGVSIKNIIVGAGSVRIIDGLIQTFVGTGEEVLTFEKSFVAYGQLSGFPKRKCTFAPLSDLRCNPENLLPFINDNTRVIFVANPNNQTGTVISHVELDNFMGKISSNIVVAIDEAYAEYVNDPSFPNSLDLQKKYPNLVIVHSFSKIYGLAGLRIGYAIMEESKAAKMTEGQIPFSLNYLSSGAAIASMDDKDFIKESALSNAEQRDFLFCELKYLGFNTVPSQANFIYVWFDSDEEKKKTYDALFKNGIFICDMKIFGQENALRITVGEKEINGKIISILAKKAIAYL